MLTPGTRNHVTVFVKTPHLSYIEESWTYRECAHTTLVSNNPHLAETNFTIIQFQLKVTWKDNFQATKAFWVSSLRAYNICFL